VVTGWVLCVIPLLAGGTGYLLVRLPRVDRALWRSASLQAHLVAVAVAGHHYAMATVSTIGVALLTISLVGSVYIVTRLARRIVALGLRWSAGRPGRRLLAGLAGLTALGAPAACWILQGQFQGW
jgi:putative peptide zinc metalloprotease protein